jgi:cytochrome d ubiquinol oxidase subunit I
VLLAAGSWLSGYFIIVTNAFMQHPVGHVVAPDGTLQLGDAAAFIFNPWALWQYAHNMSAAMITGSFVVAAVGALWTLLDTHREQAALYLRTGAIAGLAFSLLQVFPTGDRQGKLVAEHQPASLAAMEGLFRGGPSASLAVIGQPDLAHHELENAIEVPGLLSFLTYGTFGSTVRGLDDFPPDQVPDNIEVLYFAYHVMVGLGTAFIALMAWASFLLWRGRLEASRATLWALMLAAPFPYIATTAGWMTAELGRQPWLIYGVLRTLAGTSPQVSAGDTVFSLLGFCGLYLVVGLLFLYLVGREILRGPAPAAEGH